MLVVMLSVVGSEHGRQNQPGLQEKKRHVTESFVFFPHKEKNHFFHVFSRLSAVQKMHVMLFGS